MTDRKACTSLIVRLKIAMTLASQKRKPFRSEYDRYITITTIAKSQLCGSRLNAGQNETMQASSIG